MQYYRQDLDKKDFRALRSSFVSMLIRFITCVVQEGFGSASCTIFGASIQGLCSRSPSLTTELNLAAALKHYDGVKTFNLNLHDKGLSLLEVKGHPQDNVLSNG